MTYDNSRVAVTHICACALAGVCAATTFGWCNLNSSGSGEGCDCCSCCADLFRTDPFEKQVLEEMELQANARGNTQPQMLAEAPDALVNTQPTAREFMSVTPS